MNYEPEFCEGEFEGSIASMTNAEYAAYKEKQQQYRTDPEAYTEDDARRDEVQANYETDAKLGLI